MTVSGTSRKRVLIVFTSTDYIDLIYRNYPGRTIFVTDPAERARGEVAAPDEQSEILVAMDRPEMVMGQIRRHMDRYGFACSGVACFDCEAMPLASLIAHELGLPYPSREAVLASRSKSLSKECWRQAGLDCPEAEEVETVEQVAAFCGGRGEERVILKPLTGSGSELVFLCRTAGEYASAVAAMRRGLTERSMQLMYAGYEVDGRSVDPSNLFIAEEYVEGTEYSCDFIIDGDSVRVVRIARKWLKPDPSPGIAWAYTVPEEPPPSLGPEQFTAMLRTAAQALGIERALCMLDFIVSGSRVTLLELAPRPGGDCLPPLIRRSCGLDMLALATDFAEGRHWNVPLPAQWQRLVGLRLFAPRPGTLASLDAGSIIRDPRVIEVNLTGRPGRRVRHPPDDYHSRVIGYVIFRPSAYEAIEEECSELHDRLKIEYVVDGGP